jgi:hypothetical protein
MEAGCEMRRSSYLERVARVPIPGTASLAPPRFAGRRWEARQPLEPPAGEELRPVVRASAPVAADARPAIASLAPVSPALPNRPRVEAETPRVEPQAIHTQRAPVLIPAVPIPSRSPEQAAVKPRRTSDEPFHLETPSSAPPSAPGPFAIPRAVERPIEMAAAVTPAVRIGSIEVVITPPPQTAASPAPTAPQINPVAVAQPHAFSPAQAGGALRPLSRGFVSSFGFRQE